MDSYSPAHIYRVGNTSGSSDCKDTITEVKTDINVLNLLKKKVKEMPYKSYNEEEVDKVTEGIIKKHNVNGYRARKDIRNLTRFFLFHNQEMRSISQIRTIVAKTMVQKIMSDPLEDPVFKAREDIKPIQA